MNPASVDPKSIREALSAVCPRPAALEERWLACILDHGIDGLPADMRSQALRAIGNDPEVAATLAELDDPDHHIGARSHGFRVTTAWRVAFAACTALATGASIWVLGHAGHASQAPQVLDGSLPSGTPTATGPSGIELLLLSTAWLLAVVTFMPAFVLPRNAAKARARATSAHAGA